MGPCHLWRVDERVVIESEIPFPDLKLREFSRMKVYYQEKPYYLSERSGPGPGDKKHRYVLSPWTEGEGGSAQAIFFDADYVAHVAGDRHRELRNHLLFYILIVFYPVLGYLWTGPKRFLNRIGFEARGMSGVSNLLSFGLALLASALAAIYLRAGMVLWPCVLLAPILFLDCVIRYSRGLQGEDTIPPGFMEWLFRRKQRYE